MQQVSLALHKTVPPWGAHGRGCHQGQGGVRLLAGVVGLNLGGGEGLAPCVDTSDVLT